LREGSHEARPVRTGDQKRREVVLIEQGHAV
jgi:hypothetical protein